MPKGPVGTPVALMREKASRLENEMVEAECQLASARERERPWEEAFWRTHNHLEGIHQDRSSGSTITKIALLAAYDRRLIAGHAWHPFKIERKRLETWMKEIRKELTELNKKIGI